MEKDRKAGEDKLPDIFKMKNKGFTLIEILVASAIFAIVLTGIYSSFYAGMFGYRNIQENIGIFQSGRKALELMNKDIRNAFSYSSEKSGFQGGAETVSFFTLSDVFRQEAISRDFAFVSYGTESGRLMRLCRKDKEALNEALETEAEEVAAYVQTLSFEYGYLQAGQERLSWKSTWEEEGLPDALKIKLVLKGKIKEEFERIVFLP